MNPRIWMGLPVIAGLATLLVATTDSVGEPSGGPDKAIDQSKPTIKPTMTVEEARGRAKLLHTTYESTLIAVHREYFEKSQRQQVPARVLESVFFWVDRENRIKTRWISVNTEAMNLKHKPKSDVEKQAAKALGSGEEAFELIKDGIYHRAGAITLVASCLSCHESGFVQRRKRRRVAGLVISIPVERRGPDDSR